MNRLSQVRSPRFWFPVLVSIAFLSACRSEPKANASQNQAVPVKIEAVRSSLVEMGEEFNASLESRQSVDLRPRIEGQVSRIYVRAGDAVKAGQLIMQIDPRQQQATTLGSAASADSALAGMKSAESAVSSAQATLKTHQADRVARLADVKFNQQQYDRFSDLYKSGAANKQTLDQYANSLAAARANLGAVEARIQAQRAEIEARRAEVGRAERTFQQAQATTDSQKVELEFFRITAPFTGSVGAIPVKEGDFVNTSSRLAALTQNNSLEVNVSVPTEKVKQMRIGTRIDLVNLQGQTMGAGRVFMIAPNVANDTQTVLVKALVDNADGALRADQQLRARVIWQRSPGTLIPTTAISRIAGQDFVYIAEKDGDKVVAKQKPIKVGIIRGNDQQVLDGVKPGDQIITTGLTKISDGAAVVNESELSAPKPEEKT
jgi:multidrug efflux pump subunit AcrA (membrane-fusion protein)